MNLLIRRAPPAARLVAQSFAPWYLEPEVTNASRPQLYPKEIHDLLRNFTPAARLGPVSPRTHGPRAPARRDDIRDVADDDAETTEIPASRSVPPHVPPARVVTTDDDLPSVIVDLHAERLEVNELVEMQRASDVDGLLTASETSEFPGGADRRRGSAWRSTGAPGRIRRG